MSLRVYHTGRTKHAADLKGTGAEMHGGRWNKEGTACIYTSATKALSLLEYAANVRLNDLPGDLSITTYEIPDHCWKTIATDSLPPNWQQRPFPEETAAFGSRLLTEREYPAIRIPSVIVPDEFNYLLNPLHPLFHKVTIADISPLHFDSRIKQ